MLRWLDKKRAPRRQKRRQRPGALDLLLPPKRCFFFSVIFLGVATNSLRLSTHRVDATEQVLVEAHLVKRLGGLLPLGVELATALGVLFLIDFWMIGKKKVRERRFGRRRCRRRMKKQNQRPAAGASAAGWRASASLLPHSSDRIRSESPARGVGEAGQPEGEARSRAKSVEPPLPAPLSLSAAGRRQIQRDSPLLPARRFSGHRQLRQRPQPRRLQPWFRKGVVFSRKGARPGARYFQERERKKGAKSESESVFSKRK